MTDLAKKTSQETKQEKIFDVVCSVVINENENKEPYNSIKIFKAINSSIKDNFLSNELPP